MDPPGAEAPDEADGIDATDAPDGRRLRRERGRAAVIDAFFVLLAEGQRTPTAEAMAARADISQSSLFRYFDNLDDLQRQAIDTHFARHAEHFALPDQNGAPLATRIKGLVAARLDLHETVAPVARLARSRALGNPILDATLQVTRQELTAQVEHHFAPELDQLSPAVAGDLIDLVATLTSFEAWELLAETGRTRRQIQRAWTTALTALLRAST